MSQTRNPSKNHKNFYTILDIEQNATTDQIKSAYHKQALKWHPDKNPNQKERADKKFKKIVAAFSTLSDPNKRQNYDATLPASRADKKEPSELKTDKPYHNYREYLNHYNGLINPGVALPTGDVIVGLDNDNQHASFYVFNADMEFVRRFSQHKRSVNQMTLLANGNIAVCDWKRDSPIHIYNPNTGKLVSELYPRATPWLMFTINNHILVVDNNIHATIALYNALNGAVIAQAETNYWIERVALANEKILLIPHASKSTVNQCQIYNHRLNRIGQFAIARMDNAEAMIALDDEMVIIVARNNYGLTAYVHKLNSGLLVSKFNVDMSNINSAAILENTLLLADGWGVIKAYDPARGTLINSTKTPMPRFTSADVVKALYTQQMEKTFSADSNAGFELHLAAKLGQLDKVDTLLANNASINALDQNGLSALNYAIKYHHLNLIRFLLNKNADVTTLDTEAKQLCLYIAAENGLADVASKLLEQGACVNDTRLGETLLHIAVKNKHSNVVTVLLSNGASANETFQDKPLHFLAIENGDVATMNVFLAFGAKIDEVDKKSDTALHTVFRTGNLAFARELIKHKANINATNALGEKPIDVAPNDKKLQFNLLLFSRQTKLEANSWWGLGRSFFPSSELNQKKNMLPAVKALKKVVFEAADPNTLDPYKEKLDESEFAPIFRGLKK